MINHSPYSDPSNKRVEFPLGFGSFNLKLITIENINFTNDVGLERMIFQNTY